MSNLWPTQRVCEVADGIVTMVHGQGEMGVSNASFIIEGKRAFVVDTMTFPEMAQGMLQEIERRGAQVETVLNTHHHLDHMGGNALFTGAHLFAHPQSVQAMQQLGLPQERYDQLMPKFRGRFAGLRLALPQPQLDLLVPPQGGELLVFPSAHTIADACIWFARSRVLLAGDLCFIGVTPLAVHGLISGWLEALDTLIALEPAVVVPGHGPIGTLADLIVLRDYFATIQAVSIPSTGSRKDIGSLCPPGGGVYTPNPDESSGNARGRQAVQEHIPLDEVLRHLDLGPASEWIESERHIINIERAAQEARGEISRNNLAPMPSSALKSIPLK